MKFVDVEIAPGVMRLGLVESDSVTLDCVKVIAATAQGILDARELHPDKTLAEMYDEVKMPMELRAAHALNDRAVLEAYGMSPDATNEEIVKELFEMHDEITKHATEEANNEQRENAGG